MRTSCLFCRGRDRLRLCQLWSAGAMTESVYRWLTPTAMCHLWASPSTWLPLWMHMASQITLQRLGGHTLTPCSKPVAQFTLCVGENVRSGEWICHRIPYIPGIGLGESGSVLGSWGKERGARGIGCRLSSWHLLWSLSLPPSSTLN